MFDCRFDALGVLCEQDLINGSIVVEPKTRQNSNNSNSNLTHIVYSPWLVAGLVLVIIATVATYFLGDFKTLPEITARFKRGQTS